MFGSAESKHPGPTNGEIISEEFQRMLSQFTNVTWRKEARCHAVNKSVLMWRGRIERGAGTNNFSRG